MNNEDIAGGIVGCGCLVIVILCFPLSLMGMSWFESTFALPMEIARIEQLREDALGVDPAQAEDVIGQVTVVNQRIRDRQAANQIFLMGLSVPDEWNSIEFIPVPQ